MPHQPYFVDKVKVPSVTTILYRFKESGGLNHWHWQQGMAGLNYWETKTDAANSGTICHEMVECNIKSTAFNPEGKDPALLEKARHAFMAYMEWKSNNKVIVTMSEHPLVSRKHMFGGCLDALLVNKSLRLGDWKTSNDIYTDMLIQVAGGYSLLWEENYPNDKLEGVEILRFSKPKQPDDPVSFHHHFWGPEIIPLAQKQFLLFREAYDLDKRLKSLL